MPETVIDRLLKALETKEQSTQELADSLKIPVSTARSVISFLTRTVLTEPIPIAKRCKGFQPITTPGKRRGKKFKLTQAGQEYIKGHEVGSHES